MMHCIPRFRAGAAAAHTAPVYSTTTVIIFVLIVAVAALFLYLLNKALD